jgi:hypothetical protein
MSAQIICFEFKKRFPQKTAIGRCEHDDQRSPHLSETSHGASHCSSMKTIRRSIELFISLAQNWSQEWRSSQRHCVFISW